MALSITQVTSNGTQTIFPFNFDIPLNGLVDVYRTLSGATANETTDIVLVSEYSITYNTPSGQFTKGSVVFNTAPPLNSIITMTPRPNGAIDIDFTQQGQLIPANLNRGFAEHTTPIDYSFGLFTDRTLRYNINVNAANIQYSTLLPELPPKAFWRRNTISNGETGAGMSAQDYDSFIQEVSVDLSQAGGLLEEISAVANVGQTEFPLVSAGTPWVGVTLPALVVHVNGLRLPQTGSYTITVVTNPTLANPSKLIFNAGLALNDKVLIDRPQPTASTTLMTINSNNATFDTSSRVPDRALSNVTGVTKTAIAPLVGDTVNTVNTLVSRDGSRNINVSTVTTADIKMSAADATTAQPKIATVDGSGNIKPMALADFYSLTKPKFIKISPVDMKPPFSASTRTTFATSIQSLLTTANPLLAKAMGFNVFIQQGSALTDTIGIQAGALPSTDNVVVINGSVTRITITVPIIDVDMYAFATNITEHVPDSGIVLEGGFYFV